ncbi:unnamed protein product [Mycena citricolor]|uniref:Uncharacterized protein n=1 Tax=Mycena citricolor TaxID=2018698 RepID=A0AAD2GRA1_9AGAR|nr:unnamed protein product [Mycena citricolor]
MSMLTNTVRESYAACACVHTANSIIAWAPVKPVASCNCRTFLCRAKEVSHANHAHCNSRNRRERVALAGQDDGQWTSGHSVRGCMHAPCFRNDGDLWPWRASG